MVAEAASPSPECLPFLPIPLLRRQWIRRVTYERFASSASMARLHETSYVRNATSYKESQLTWAQRFMARLYQCRSILGCIRLLSCCCMVCESIWPQKDYRRRILLVGPWHRTAGRCHVSSNVRCWQIVHRWGFCLLLCDSSVDDRDRLSNTQRYCHGLLQLRLVRWKPRRCLGHLRNARLLWQLGMANSIDFAGMCTDRWGCWAHFCT